MPSKVRKNRAHSSGPSKRHKKNAINSKGPRNVHLYTREYDDSKLRIRTDGTEDDSLKDFIVEDVSSNRYTHRHNSESEDYYSYSDDSNGGDLKTKTPRLSTEPLYSLLKDKINISERGPGGSSVRDDKKEIDVALSELMEEVFSSLDSELRDITVKQLRNSDHIDPNVYNVEGESQRVSNMKSNTSCVDKPGIKPKGRSLPSGTSNANSVYYSDLDNDFGGDDEFDTSILREIDEIERKSGAEKVYPPCLKEWPITAKDSWKDIMSLDPFFDSHSTAALNSSIDSDMGGLTAYYIDVLEKDGNIYLFCKCEIQGVVKTICVLIRNFLRDLFFLPKKQPSDNSEFGTSPNVAFTDVMSEVDQILKRHKISNYTLTVERKKYSFALPGVPREAYYVVASYPYTQHSLPRNITGQTFSTIFGIGFPAVQLFVLKLGIMGPSWITIDGYTAPSTKDLVIDSYTNIKLLDKDDIKDKLQTPPLSVMALNFFSTIETKGSLIIIAASARGCSQDNLSHLSEGKGNYVHTALYIPDEAFPHSAMVGIISNGDTSEYVPFNSESSLLEYIISLVIANDPDIIIGYDIAGGSLDTLINSLRNSNIKDWSAIGRLKQTRWPKVETRLNYTGLTYDKRQLVGGRIVCDIRLAAESSLNFKSYDLETLALEILNIDISKNCSNGLIYSYDISNISDIARGVKDSVKIILDIADKLNILPLSLQLANIYGNLWSRSIMGANSDGNEHFLSHEFYKRGFVLPDKSLTKYERFSNIHASEGRMNDIDNEQTSYYRKKSSYAGGLVLEPVRGLYDTCVLLLDFNSLYPSIIREYNICFTTVNWSNYIDNPDGINVSEINTEKGVLPELIGVMVEKRRQIKSFMSDRNLPDRVMKKYEIKQKAFKLAANSMYGCLGFRNSRFYAKPLASLITFMGRKALSDTVSVSKSMGLNVIYGDTDSIMILTKTKNYHEALKVGNNLKVAINSKYSHIEIDMESVISKILLYRKKKYACRTFKEVKGVVKELGVQVRGLEVVRREWCDLVHDSSSWILDQLLSDIPRTVVIENIKVYLKRIFNDAMNGKIPIEKLIIRKNLSKDPENYPDKNSQPHVLVALALKAKGIPIRAKDTIAYIICDLNENTSNLLSHKARHYNEVLENGLLPDYSWYFSNQLLPSLSRLIEVIEGIDTICMAECFGLDTKKYINTADRSSNAISSINTDNPLSSVFGKWTISCNACMETLIFPGVIYLKDINHKNKGKTPCLGTECPNPKCKNEFSLKYLAASLHLFVRKCIRMYAGARAGCEDQICTYRSNGVSIYGTHCRNATCAGPVKLTIPSENLFKQLIYLKNLVSTSKVANSPDSSDDGITEALELRRKCFSCLESVVQKYLDVNSFRFINIKSILAHVLQQNVNHGIDITTPYS